jgi:hypothetical protein
MLWQILLLPMSSVYKSVVIGILLWLDTLTNTQPCAYSGPCGLFYCTSKEYHLYHVLLRVVYWDCVVVCTPRALMTEIMSLATESKSRFILPGLRVFTCESLYVCEALARFVCETQITNAITHTNNAVYLLFIMHMQSFFMLCTISCVICIMLYYNCIEFTRIIMLS